MRAYILVFQSACGVVGGNGQRGNTSLGLWGPGRALSEAQARVHSAPGGDF